MGKPMLTCCLKYIISHETGKKVRRKGKKIRRKEKEVRRKEKKVRRKGKILLVNRCWHAS
jgi:hypothetical protein